MRRAGSPWVAAISAARRYSVYVAPASGGVEVLVARDFAYRTASPVGALRNLAVYARTEAFYLSRQITVTPGGS